MEFSGIPIHLSIIQQMLSFDKFHFLSSFQNNLYNVIKIRDNDITYFNDCVKHDSIFWCIYDTQNTKG